MRVVRWMWCAALAVVLLLLTEPRAYAYTDPGSGALLWQALVAAFVGAVIAGTFAARSFARPRFRARDTVRDACRLAYPGHRAGFRMQRHVRARQDRARRQHGSQRR